MQATLDETDRRRKLQKAYNKKHGITPKSIVKNILELRNSPEEHDYFTVSIDDDKALRDLTKGKMPDVLAKLRKEMHDAADDMEFERAAKIRDHIRDLESLEIRMG